jgi:hypothetical protein
VKLAIMQPYLLPYLGYFQLITAADRFVFLDDVNYIKKGWINRNRVLMNGNDYLISFNISGASQNKKINELTFDFDEQWQKKFWGTIHATYSKAPFYRATESILGRIFDTTERNVSRFIFNSFQILANQFEIKTELIASSAIYGETELKGQDRILMICQKNGATQYINPPGGRELYSAEAFASKSIALSFLMPELKSYPQFANGFVPGLSIIDVMMFNDVHKMKSFFNDYSLES